MDEIGRSAIHIVHSTRTLTLAILPAQTFRVSADEPATFTYLLGKKELKATGPKVTVQVRRGTSMFFATATDNAGNVSRTISFKWTVLARR